jgi:S1-C subfamily serine protease
VATTKRLRLYSAIVEREDKTYTYRGSRLRLYLVVLVLMLVATSCNSAVTMRQPGLVNIDPPATPLAGGDLVNSVRLVAQKVKPAVVQITSMQVSVDQMNQASEVPTGVGSGVILDRQGYILTNDHVIEGAQQLLVGLPDGRSFEAKLIGSDPTMDLAVVQINAPIFRSPTWAIPAKCKWAIGWWRLATPWRWKAAPR